MAKYPINLDLTGRKALVIGAGDVAARKAKSLCATGADVTVVAKEVSEKFSRVCEGLEFEMIVGEYCTEHLEDVIIAIAATNNSELNKRIYAECRERKVICNVVDVPELCDFYVPAIVERGKLMIAIGTDGASPAYAAHVRRKLQEMFTEDHGRFVDELQKARVKVIAACEPDMRKPVLEELVKDDSFDFLLANGADKWQERADGVIQKHLSNK
jgi:precorrin-2 dehydrogenase/sirohydrochlorin ferrochelatase